MPSEQNLARSFRILMHYVRLALQRLRPVLIALLWPAVLFGLSRLRPELFERWDRITDLAALALAGSGALLAAGFAQWRLTHALILITAAGLGAHNPNWPFAVTALPILTLGVLPWLRESGATGPATATTVAIGVVLVALAWRGGAPAELVDQGMQASFTWRGHTLSWVGAATALLALITIARILIVQSAADLAFAGALLSLMPLLPHTWPLPESAATAAAVLTVWTGLLLHAWRLAYLDELTGLPNRRALEDALKAGPGHWCVGMLDVDHFKKFNDRWGHDVGDQVLRRVAAALARVEGRGRAFRYGGEEFTVLFPHGDLTRAAAALETIREAVAATPFRIRGQRTGKEARGRQTTTNEQTITVSAGLAAGSQDTAATFKRADEALYKAKKKGRNRLVRAD